MCATNHTIGESLVLEYDNFISMNEEVFLECLSKKKLFDVEDRPLRLHKHMDEQQEEGDTFFRCISTALTCVEKHHVKIRDRKSVV